MGLFVNIVHILWCVGLPPLSTMDKFSLKLRKSLVVHSSNSWVKVNKNVNIQLLSSILRKVNKFCTFLTPKKLPNVFTPRDIYTQPPVLQMKQIAGLCRWCVVCLDGSSVKLTIPDDIMMILVEWSIGRNNTHSQLHGNKNNFSGLKPNPRLGDVFPIGGQVSHNSVGASRTHAASNRQCH